MCDIIFRRQNLNSDDSDQSSDDSDSDDSDQSSDDTGQSSEDTDQKLIKFHTKNLFRAAFLLIHLIDSINGTYLHILINFSNLDS